MSAGRMAAGLCVFLGGFFGGFRRFLRTDAMEAPAGTGRRLPGAEHTLFGGYGPFVALVALLLAMALLAPTIAPERVVTTRSRPASGPGAAAPFPNLRSSVTTGVTEERRFAGARAPSPNLRSSVTTGVTEERRFAGEAAGRGGR